VGNTLWIIGLVVLCVVMLFVATRIEPHRVSADGLNFSCRVQELTEGGLPSVKWTEARARIVDQHVVLAKGGLLRPRATSYERPRSVVSRSAEAPPRFAIFVLEDEGALSVLRVPASSPAVARLEELLPH
jgi:hypothetical protein